MTASTPDQPTRPLAARAAPALLLLMSLAGAYELLARHRADAGWITTDNAFVAGNVVTLSAQAGTVAASIAASRTTGRSSAPRHRPARARRAANAWPISWWRTPRAM